MAMKRTVLKAVGLTVIVSLWACESKLKVSTNTPPQADQMKKTGPVKLTGDVQCVDPDLDLLYTGVQITMCDGSLAQGRLDLTKVKTETTEKTAAIAEQLGISQLSPENIRDGVMIAGIKGSYKAPAECSADGETNCITNSVFRAVDTQAISAWDIRKDRTVAGIQGKISYNKNMVNTTLYDRTSGPGATVGADVYDTIDDFNAAGAFPVAAPPGFEPATVANWVRDTISDDGMGGGTASNSVCDGAEDCVYKDRFTSLYWSRYDGTPRNLDNSITHCEGLDYGGYDDWRLPTQKELQQAYINGIWSLKDSSQLNLDYDLISATKPSNDTGIWTVCVAIGCTYQANGATARAQICVR